MNIKQYLFSAAAVAFTTFCHASSGQLQNTIQGVFNITEIAADIYVAQPKFGGANTTIVINESDVLLADPPQGPADVHALLEEIGKLTENPVRYVVNSHWHGDHQGGNKALKQAIGNNLLVIAHENTRHDITALATPELRRFSQFYAAMADKAETSLAQESASLTNEQKAQISRYVREQRAFAQQAATYEYALPDLVINRNLTLFRGRREIRILHFGKAHTRGDLVVYLPKEKIVVAGDLLTAPYIVPRSAYPRDHIATLKALSNLEYEQMVLGHGGPVKYDNELLNSMIDFLSTIVKEVQTGIAAGLNDDDLLSKILNSPGVQSFNARIAWDEPGGLKFLTFEQLVTMTVDRAAKETRGNLE